MPLLLLEELLLDELSAEESSLEVLSSLLSSTSLYVNVNLSVTASQFLQCRDIIPSSVGVAALSTVHSFSKSWVMGICSSSVAEHLMQARCFVPVLVHVAALIISQPPYL